MADLIGGSAAPASSHSKQPSASFRPAAAPAPTSSPSGIRGPRMIMQERAAREARRAEAEQQQAQERSRAEQERSRAEQEARLLEEAQRRSTERRAAAAGVATGPGTGAGADNQEYVDPQRQAQAQAAPEVNQGRTRASTTAQPTTQRPTHRSTASQQMPTMAQPFAATAPTQQPTPGAQAGDNRTQSTTGSKPRNSFPHAFERWETLSAHWEGLTSYWIRKLEQNKDEINRDTLNQQLARQVTDLSAAGANLFHAVVELQRLRASSERKFQRWFFETRADLERSQEVNAMLEAALEQERRGRAEAIREAVENERGTSKAQKQLAEMRKELAISKEEARRAWEELGRREQEERDRTLSLQTGQPTLVGGYQVVPMTQGGPSRHDSTRAPVTYQPEYGQDYPAERATPPQTVPPTTSAAEETYYRSHAPQTGSSSLAQPPAGTEGGYSGVEYVTDANGNFMLDSHGNKIPSAGPPSTYKGSDSEVEGEYETPATTNPPSGNPSGSQDMPSTSGGGDQWTGAYSDDQDYSGQGYGTPGWETVPRHHHPTRLSDVIEEEDERSRTSTGRI